MVTVKYVATNEYGYHWPNTEADTLDDCIEKAKVAFNVNSWEELDRKGICVEEVATTSKCVKGCREGGDVIAR